jgi:hypothetical protein
MNAATEAPPTHHPDSLWLRIDWETASRVFEFPAGSARAIAVGSSKTCEVRARRSGLSPVCFCFERENDRILIVPMSEGDLRIGGFRISRPEPLAGATTIEIGATIVNATILTDRAEQTAPTSELPTRETVSSHMIRLPADGDPTCIATAAIKIGPSDAPLLAAPARALEEDFTAPPTEIMSVFRFWDEPVEGPAPSAVLIGDPRVSTQDTTSFDLPVLANPIHLATETNGTEPHQFAGEAGASMARLGLLARRWPIQVAASVLAAAIALVSLLLGARKVMAPERMRLPETTAVVSRAAPPRSTASRLASELLDPASGPSPVSNTKPAPGNVQPEQIITATARTTPPPARATQRTTSPGDAESLTALKYVVDGRDADAFRAYAALAARSPNNTAYRAVVRLLQRRGEEGCARPPVMPVFCPDIRR